MIVPFVGPSYLDRALSVSAQRCLNLYPEQVETEDSKVRWILRRGPGTVLAYDIVTAQTGNIRGMHTTSTVNSDGSVRVFVVAANELIELKDEPNYVSRGTISNLQNPVQFSDDGKTLCLVDGVDLWTLDLTDDDAIPVRVNFSPEVRPSSVVFIGGYTIINNTYLDPTISFPPTTTLWYFSDLYDANTWDTTIRIGSAELSADPITKMARVADSIWMFGPRSYQVFSISGDDRGPLTPQGGAASDYGCLAPSSVATFGDTVCWLGTTSKGGIMVYKSAGYSAERVSTHALEQALESYATVSDAVAFFYSQEGHSFYVLTFPDAEATWVYDMQTKMWHERASRIIGSGTLTRWEPLYSSAKLDRVFVGSTLNTKIFRLDLKKYNEWDDREILCLRSGPVLDSDTQRVSHIAAVFEMETGVGLTTGLGSDPKVMMRYSDDGGHTWSSKYFESMGRMGEYRKRVIFRRLGMSRERVYEISVTDPVPVTLISASVQSTPSGTY